MAGGERFSLGTPEDVYQFVYSEVKASAPLIRILLRLLDSSGELHITVERDVEDTEISAEAEALGTSITPIRIQIWSAKSRREFLGAVLLRANSNDESGLRTLADTYVVSPGRSDHEKVYLKVSARLPVPEKKRGSIPGYPFIQQIPSRWPCVYAALRMFSIWMKRTKNSVLKYDKTKSGLTFPEIEELADCGSGGMTRIELEGCIRKMGFSPISYVYNDPDHPAAFHPDSLIYSYSESGIPVFVVFGTEDGDIGHVVTILGHSIESDAWWPEAEQGYYSQVLSDRPPYLRTTAWMDFIGHDDNFGPYLRIPRNFLDIDLADYEDLDLEGKEGIDEVVCKHRRKRIQTSRLWEVLVPFRDDYIRAEKAEALAYLALTDSEVRALTSQSDPKHLSLTAQRMEELSPKCDR